MMTSIEGYFDFMSNMPTTKVADISESIAKIFEVESKENIISNWLSFLLEPNRFKDDAPLKALLGLFLKANQFEETDADTVMVSREYTLLNRRRVDLLIETDDLIIGIENKIFSSIHNDQLNDYYDKLRIQHKKNDRDRKIMIVLLAPSWSNDVIQSKIDNNKQVVVTYEKLANAFAEIPQKNIEFRNYFILNEFVKYVNDYIREGAMELNNEWALFNSKHSVELTEIVKNGEQQLGILSDKIEKTLNKVGKTIFPAIEGEETSFHVYRKVTTKAFYFQLFHISWGKNKIHYEIGAGDYESRGFILPTKLHFLIDVEDKETRKIMNSKPNVFKDFNHIQTHNIIKEFVIDYSSQEAFNATFQDIENEIYNWHKSNKDALLNVIPSIKV
ncbi:PD-(D/E)XK nuclease family protein [Macrococcoides caseolyticum]|uniref:PD-(D/E)XK nuclease family protein n=1 Tax=Macrococcoides caseolyticum TaxID=69966 RepID=UPI0024BD3E86|nr:PD-(D/E)XK nuclease family protein [Macrococcus caseolyticus]MDJ1089404.1 PD-(D/E)XK nuclease family protein [Macrococcus caseolyticus]